MSRVGLSIYSGLKRVFGGLGLRRYGWVNRLHDRFLSGVKSRHAVVHGHRMALDPRDSLELSVNGVYEPLQTRLVEAYLRPGDAVVDVGANIGYYTLIFARGVGAGGVVMTFEPDPENFALLKANIAGNGYGNCIPFHGALSNRGGTLRLHRNEENRGDHRIYDTGEGRAGVEVSAWRLDEVPGGRGGRLALVKIDVQGAEMKVVAGMGELLARCDAVLFEFWPSAIRMAGDDPGKLVEVLGRVGLGLYLVDEVALRIEPAEVGLLFERSREDAGYQVNLLGLSEAGLQRLGGRQGIERFGLA